MPRKCRTKATRVLCFFSMYNRQPLGTQEGMNHRSNIMANEYKQCPNGHYYQEPQCPYCKPTTPFDGGKATSAETQMFDVLGGQSGETQRPTEPMPGLGNSTGSEKTTVIDGGTIVRNPGVRTPNGGGSAPMSGHNTVFIGDEDETEVVITPTGEKVQRVYREARKLVGWLVSYTLDSLGVDFKLYEGRNIIGRDQECSITVSDNMVSSKHAVLLFRAGKYSITDSQSSHGTFVNDRDIELEPCYLSDGDIIKIGQTLFKFRSAL